MSVAAVIEAAGLVAGYGGTPAVHDVDLVVHAGEVVALLGPNGAGKSTTLLALAGAVPAMGGTVSVVGAPVRPGRAHRQAKRGLGHVTERRGIFSELTVAQNLRVATASRADIAATLQHFPALAAVSERRAGVLSGGEQQMLAIARAVARRPAALLVDELSLGLAPRITRQLLDVVRTIAATDGTAVLLVEQHLDLALAVADRAYVMNRGRIVLRGPAAELRDRRGDIQSSYFGDLDDLLEQAAID